MTDLVIGGGRRYHSQRSLRSVAIAVVLGLASLLVVYVLFDRMVTYVEPDTAVSESPLAIAGAPGSAGARLGFEGSSVSQVGGLTVLRLSGPPAALGAAHGRLLATELSAQHAALAPLLDHAVPRQALLDGLMHDWRVRWRYRLLDDGIPGHQLVEIAHVLEGARQAADDVPGYEPFVRSQAAFDLGQPAPRSAGADFRAVTRATSFVAALRDPSGDRLLVGRSLALPGAEDGGDAAAARPLVSFVRSPDVIAFASVGWPGLVGALTGVNAEGVA
ncbi:MAG TPA: hypothetical protein VNM90_00815, partial [Haliangium sp.]|nr:hypothetical protein [Haliangium sp.]